MLQHSCTCSAELKFISDFADKGLCSVHLSFGCLHSTELDNKWLQQCHKITQDIHFLIILNIRIHVF